jgi:hypothetical protein
MLDESPLVYIFVSYAQKKVVVAHFVKVVACLFVIVVILRERERVVVVESQRALYKFVEGAVEDFLYLCILSLE